MAKTLCRNFDSEGKTIFVFQCNTLSRCHVVALSILRVDFATLKIVASLALIVLFWNKQNFFIAVYTLQKNLFTLLITLTINETLITLNETLITPNQTLIRTQESETDDAGSASPIYEEVRLYLPF